MIFSVQHLAPVIEAVTGTNTDISDQVSDHDVSGLSGEC